MTAELDISENQLSLVRLLAPGTLARPRCQFRAGPAGFPSELAQNRVRTGSEPAQNRLGLYIYIIILYGHQGLGITRGSVSKLLLIYFMFYLNNIPNVFKQYYRSRTPGELVA